MSSLAVPGFTTAIAFMRSWGFKVVEMPGWQNANNGIADYIGGIPCGHVNHHFVCSLNPDQDYIDSMVAMLVNGYDSTPGPVVPSFIDMHGVTYIIAGGPSNHAGQGASSVVNRALNGQAPLGAAVNVGATDDGVKNNRWSGTETQHPGDATPYPQPMLDALIAWNAAQNLAFKRSANTSIMHYESTRRKDDMSLMDGVNGVGGQWLRSQIAAKMLNPIPTPPAPPTPDPEEYDIMYQLITDGTKYYYYGFGKFVEMPNDGTWTAGFNAKQFPVGPADKAKVPKRVSGEVDNVMMNEIRASLVKR